MRDVFQKRRGVFRKRCLNYLRYVLNDHFVLVLMFFAGFLSLQYRQLLLTVSGYSIELLLVLVGLSLLFLYSGRIASHVEEADPAFLLPKEEDVSNELVLAARRTVLVGLLLQAVVQSLFVPLYLKMGIPVWLIFLGFVGLLLAKVYLVRYQVGRYVFRGVLAWERLIGDEKKRRQSILRFFALFTTVKGITTSVKRRAYLDLVFDIKWKRQTWFYLYLRAFLRAGEYLSLTLRLLFLIVLTMISVSENWLAVGLALVFHYLLLFQLLGLYTHYDYYVMGQLYPLDITQKRIGFQKLMRTILYLILSIEWLLAIFFIGEKTEVLALVLLGVLLHEVYLPLKLKKLID